MFLTFFSCSKNDSTIEKKISIEYLTDPPAAQSLPTLSNTNKSQFSRFGFRLFYITVVKLNQSNANGNTKAIPDETF